MRIRTVSERGCGVGLSVVTAGLVLAIASGCPGDDSAAEGTASSSESGSTGSGGSMTTTGDDATATGSTGSTGSTSAVDSGTDTADTTDTGSGSSSEGTGEDTGMLCEDEPTVEEAAVLEVTVNLENDTKQSVWVIDVPDLCEEFGVAQGARTLARSIGASCGCECPAPGSPIATLTELAPGQTHSVQWDGRALAVYQDLFDCGKGRCWSEIAGQPQPVEPGTITMTLPVYESAEFAWPGESVGPLAEVCPSPLSFELSFELGTEDIVVDVLLSEVTLR